MNWTRGDAVLVDFGMVGKVRPAVVVSIPRADSQRNMSVVVPLTTEMRGGETEVAFPKPRWLMDACAANLIGIGGVDNAKIVRVLGRMPPATMDAVSDGLARMLGL
jgi:mRNA-degrading endonuclease toxin of MazEF toxin-antitoxin module